MNIPKVIIALPALAAALAFPSASMAEDLQPGKYRQTVTTDLPGAGKPLVGDQCITQKDIDSGFSKIGVEEDMDCKVSDFKRGNGTVSYRMRCDDEGRVTTVQATGTFTGDSYDFSLTMNPPGGAKVMKMRAVGKRVGACSGK